MNQLYAAQTKETEKAENRCALCGKTRGGIFYKSKYICPSCLLLIKKISYS